MSLADFKQALMGQQKDLVLKFMEQYFINNMENEFGCHYVQAFDCYVAGGVNSNQSAVWYWYLMGSKKKYGDFIPWTALHFVSAIGNKEMVKLLLEKGANPTIKDKTGKDAYGIAKHLNQKSSMKVLSFFFQYKHLKMMTKDVLYSQLQDVKKQLKTKEEEIVSLSKNQTNVQIIDFSSLFVPLEMLHFQKEIASGGFGKILLGEMQVAVKKIPKDKIKGSEFENEVLFHKKLLHENVLECFGWSEEKENYYLLMELMDCDLNDYIYKKKLENSLKYQILFQIAKGIDFLHQRGIVHRDIKPKNVLIKKTNDQLKVKLSDFGVSKQKIGSNTSSITVMGTGTLIYMSPELLSQNTYGFTSDIYAFGILMYEVIYEKSPYDENTLQSSFMKFAMDICNGLRPKLPNNNLNEFEKIMVQCWEFDPKKRPTMKEIMSFLSKEGKV